MEDKYKVMSLDQLAHAMTEVRTELDAAKKIVSSLQGIWDELRKVHLPEKMEELDILGCKIAGVGTLSIRTDAYCTVPAAKKEELYNWLLNNEHEALVSSTVNASTLKAFMKEQIIAGNPLPPEDVVNFNPFTYVSITKG